MNRDFPLGWVLFGLVILWVVYVLRYDNSRVTHPNYRNSLSYRACINAADMIYRKSLEEAFADPSIWIGYKSAQDYARVSYSIARSGCDP